MQVVDAHVHVWEPASQTFPWQPIGKLRPDFSWTVQQQVTAMQQAGMDQGIIVQTSWYGYDNRYGLDCLHRHPGRFAFVGMVDPAREDVEAEMERLAAQGVGGLRIPALMRPDIAWYGTSQADRIWRKSGEIGWALCLLVRLEQAIEAASVIERFPQVKVVIDHIAHPELETPMGGPLFQELLRMARFPTVYIKVSAFPAISKSPYPHQDVLELVQRVFDAYGPKRLMWGTDHAMTQSICHFPMKQALELIDRALENESSEDRAWVTGGTAARLWNLR